MLVTLGRVCLTSTSREHEARYRLLWHFVAEFLGNFFCQSIVRDIAKRRLLIDEAPASLDRFNQIFYARPGRNAAPAERL